MTKALKPVVEVGAEGSGLAHGRQVPIGGRDDAHIGLEVAGAAEAPKGPGLEHPQQLGLDGGFDLADLIQEQGAALGPLDEAALLLVCPGEGPALVAEQLGLEELFLQGAAVHGDKVAHGSPALLMQGAGHQLLACSALALDQDRDVALRDRGDGLLHPHERRADADHEARTPLLRLEPLGTELMVAAQGGIVQGTPHHEGQLLRAYGLEQVFEGARLHGIDGVAYRAKGRQHDHRLVSHQLRQPRQAVAVGEFDIGDDQVGFVGSQVGVGFAPARCMDDLVAETA